MRKHIFQRPASHKHVQHGGFLSKKRNSCSVWYSCTFDVFLCVLFFSIFGMIHFRFVSSYHRWDKKKHKQLLEGTVVFDGRPEKIQAGVCAKWTWNIGTSKKTQHLALGRNSHHQKRHQVNHSKITSYSTRVSSLDNFVTVDLWLIYTNAVRHVS